MISEKIKFELLKMDSKNLIKKRIKIEHIQISDKDNQTILHWNISFVNGDSDDEDKYQLALGNSTKLAL